ncbi:MAG: hypothetical protein OHK0021_04820 [Bryobacter sp.]
MNNLMDLETQLNEMIQRGEMIPAVERFYAEDCLFQEGNQTPRRGGKQGQVQYLSDFFKTVKAVKGIRLHTQAVGDQATLSEWTFDLETTNGPILWNEVLRRQWRDGKVVSERFYTAG